MSNALMNVLLCSLGSHGDVHPYLALGKELLQRGNAVTFATSSHYRELIERNGIVFVAIRPEAPLHDRAIMERIMDARRGPETVIKQHVMPALRDTYQDLLEPARQADLLFSRAAAVVHQGGVGTTAQALRAGVPQLVMPFAHDQFDNAERVRRLGCGRILRRIRLAERSLACELEALLANGGLAATAREEGRLVQKERGAAHAAEVLLRRFA